jgi:tetratricopeptide (TPR) repeat protein
VHGAPLGQSAGSLLDRFTSAVRGLLQTDETPGTAGLSRIRSCSAPHQEAERERCRQAGWYHQSLARRALDREDWTSAARQAREALSWDDTRAASYLALGESFARAPHGDLAEAREAFEAAFGLEPTNSYVIHQLEQVYRSLGDTTAERAMLRRAISAGAPRLLWQSELDSLEGTRTISLAS